MFIYFCFIKNDIEKFLKYKNKWENVIYWSFWDCVVKILLGNFKIICKKKDINFDILFVMFLECKNNGKEVKWFFFKILLVVLVFLYMV